jgi:hypothetical protein
LAFSYWIDIPWFRTEGKLAAIFIKPSLGVSNWPVIYFINCTPTSSLALFNTAPSGCHFAATARAAGSNRQTHLVATVVPLAAMEGAYGSNNGAAGSNDGHRRQQQ